MEPKPNENANFLNLMLTNFDDYAAENEVLMEESTQKFDEEYTQNGMFDILYSFDGLIDNESDLTFNAKQSKDCSKEDVHNSGVTTVTIPDCGKYSFNLEELQVNRQVLHKPSIGSISIKLSSIPIILQCPKEARTRYLLRFPQLYQQFMNSSNVEKLKALFYETLTEDCVYHILTSPPMIGIRRVYELQCLTLLSSPDFYVSISDIKFFNRRIITCVGTSFGTVPYLARDQSPSSNKQITFWNFIGMPFQELDKFHQIQKQTYDRLISQKKSIRFERKTRWYLFLNRERSKVQRGMARFSSVEIFEY